MQRALLLGQSTAADKLLNNIFVTFMCESVGSSLGVSMMTMGKVRRRDAAAVVSSECCLLQATPTASCLLLVPFLHSEFVLSASAAFRGNLEWSWGPQCGLPLDGWDK